MKRFLKSNRVWKALYVNVNDFGTDDRAYVPEIWAAESLMVLEENLIMGNLVHRDFEDEIREFGDIVNTRRPGKFTAKRKIDGGSIVKQPATAEKVQVPLNQHLHTSFIIYDGQRSKSFKELVAEFLTPAVRSIARQLDSILLAQKYQFLANSVGKLGTDPAKATVIALQTKFDDLIVPEEDRYAIVTSAQKGALLNETQFTDADKFGDDGTAIRFGNLGMYYGTRFIMSQNNKNIPAGNTLAPTGYTVDLTAGYAAGSTAIVVADGTVAIPVGSWITIAGDMTPQRVTAVTATSAAAAATAIVISPGLKFAVLNNAAISIYKPASAELTAGYDAKWALPMVIADTTVDIHDGQLVSDGANYYGALPQGKDETGATISKQTSLMVDRPLDEAIADEDLLGIGPAGNFGLGFHRNAIALVNRPLALPPPNTGVRAAVANFNGYSIRVAMGYDMTVQGLVVTVDTLCGVKVLDTNLGVLFYG